MQAGKRFKEAEKEVYGNRLSGGQVHDRIPPVRNALKTLRNPAIERSLTELRKVVNALIAEHDKPSEIRIELARDLKKPRKERAQATYRNRTREKQRAEAKARLLRELGPGFEHPSRADIEKALLHEECGGICPYTGRHIDFASLFGQNPQFDVEHIIPFSRLPDDSFQNKTLCHHEENRLVKRNKIPSEAYTDAEQYQTICDRVRQWPKPNLGKLARFELRTIEQLEGFSSRQLNDTRYASKLACELLGTLYGGRDVKTDSGSRQVVFASSGMVTSTLRRGWGLEAILREAAPSANGLNKGKPRTDHRHHAIDAITIALSQPKLIATLSRANSEDPYWPRNGRTAPRIQAPWKDFVASIRPHFERMLVSHRPEHRLTGALHNGTNYSRPEADGKTVHIRRPVAGLTRSEIEQIVDPAVREIVRGKAIQFGGSLEGWSPNQQTSDWPMLPTRTGKFIPIKNVRVKKALKVFAVGESYRTRYVDYGADSIHHVAIFATKDHRGRDKWISDIIRVYEAKQRWAASRKKGGALSPLVYSTHSEDANAEFLFYLMKKDTLEIEVNGNRCIYLVSSFESDGRVNLIPLNSAGKREDQKETKLILRETLSSLMRRVPQKVQVDSIGRANHVRDWVMARP